MSKHYDVIIVGYGPVGVTAANLLGGTGLKVAVVEKEPDIYARARAISTDEEILRIWQRIGLADQLVKDMLADRPIDFVDARGRSFLSIKPITRGNGYSPQLFIYQPALEQTLRDGVARYPNVDVFCGHECTDVTEVAGGVQAEVEGVGPLRGAYLIAADGGSSPIRTKLKVGFEGRTYEDRWVVVDTKVHRGWDSVDRLRFHCDPARPAVDCPTPLDHHRWEFPVLSGEDETKLVSHNYIWQLLRHHGRTPDEVEILRAVVYSHHVRFASRWRIGRIFLAGDAAHVMPPWIGEGMASGVRDVANLCWKLAAVVRGELPDSALDSYETERQPHVRVVTSRAVTVGRIITERRRAIAAIRNVAFRLTMRIAPLRAYAREARWLPMTRHRRGLLDHSGGTGAVGHYPPQPWVLDGNGRRARLDDVLGGHWTLLHVGAGQAWTGWDGVARLRVTPPGTAPAPDTIVDCDDVLIPWMRKRRSTVVALRPDVIVYAGGTAQTLPSPPLQRGGTSSSSLRPS
jgi:3-(3-hydroxy-phenyl)propionate hydroxylase